MSEYTNARTELERQLVSCEYLPSDMKCVIMFKGCDYVEKDREYFKLFQEWHKDELVTFFKSIEFEYSSGYGGQILFGTIWMKDGTWFDRG